jgi:hypothetical protein
MRLRAPIPAAMAAFTLPFLFDYTFTIYGGNLFSTLAGEYAYSFSIALALIFLGLMARGLRTGRGRGWAALALAVCIFSHIIPAMFALVGALFLTLFELLPPSLALHDDPLGAEANGVDRAPEHKLPTRAMLWWACSTVGLGVALSGWWLLPFVLRQDYSNPMGYSNVTTWATLLFPEADWWVIIVAGIALIAAFVMRSRFGVLLGLLAGASAGATVLDPQGSIYNVRFLPLWFLAVYLLAGWGFGIGVLGAVRAWRAHRAYRFGLEPSRVNEGGRLAWFSAPVLGPALAFLAVSVVVVPPLITPLQSILPVKVGANLVTNWSSYNYTGYQKQPDYPEYLSVINLMKKASKTYGCGRAMWEYNIDEDRFGTPEALMLLPYWTNRCIDSMEGLLFESSATTPYHFLNQSELSVGPSDPQVGLDYGPLDVDLGVQHLQLLGVKYFLAEKPQTEAQAMADPALKLIGHTGPWPAVYGSTSLDTTWDLFLVRHSSIVVPLTHYPNVLRGIGASQADWCCKTAANGSAIEEPSEQWYLNPSLWDVELAQSGPDLWPVVPPQSTTRVAIKVPSTKVSRIKLTDESISFHVTRLGTPVLVKISYFPNWRATGAEGPYRVSPNLMAVVPTSHLVTLTYGPSTLDRAGELLSGAALLGVIASGSIWYLRRRRRGARESAEPSIS